MASEGAPSSAGTLDSTPSPASSGTTVPGSSTGSVASTGTAAPSSGSPAQPQQWDVEKRGLIGEAQKERRARQEYERKVAEQDARLAEAQRQIAALTNTKVPSADEADEQAVRDRFAQLYPDLAGVTKEDIEAIREFKASRQRMQQTVEHHWTTHSKAMLDSVYQGVAAELGDLTDRQKGKIAALYVHAAESDPAFLTRHDAGDATLVKEFVKDYLDDTAEPARRKQVASDLGRQRLVPQGGHRSVPSHDGKPIDVTNDKAVMDLLVDSRKGQFGRR